MFRGGSCWCCVEFPKIVQWLVKERTGSAPFCWGFDVKGSKGEWSKPQSAPLKQRLTKTTSPLQQLAWMLEKPLSFTDCFLRSGKEKRGQWLVDQKTLWCWRRMRIEEGVFSLLQSRKWGKVTKSLVGIGFDQSLISPPSEFDSYLIRARHSKKLSIIHPLAFRYGKRLNQIYSIILNGSILLGKLPFVWHVTKIWSVCRRVAIFGHWFISHLTCSRWEDDPCGAGNPRRAATSSWKGIFKSWRW